VAQETKTGRTN